MLNRLLNAFGYERRSDYDPRFAPQNWARAVSLGASVSSDTVFSNIPVAMACVRIRAELTAKVSVKIFRTDADGNRTRVTDMPLAQVLNDLANPLMTAFEFREYMSRSIDKAGNAYARIDRDAAGQVVALWPIDASKVQPELLENGRIRYRVSGARGSTVFNMEDLLHVRGTPDSSGLVGLSPIQIARGALGLAINLNETADSLARNSLRPSAVLTHPGKLSGGAKTSIAESFEKKHAGAAAAGKPIVLEEGMKWIATSWSGEDAELLESRKLSNEDTCRIFGVPPASVGIASAVSYGSAIAAAQDLVTNTLAPLAARFEQAWQRCLLSTEARQTITIEHDLASLLRGDETTQWNVYKIQREIGATSTNEIRRTQNKPPVPGGDDFSPLGASPAPADPIASIKP